MKKFITIFLAFLLLSNCTYTYATKIKQEDTLIKCAYIQGVKKESSMLKTDILDDYKNNINVDLNITELNNGEYNIKGIIKDRELNINIFADTQISKDILIYKPESLDNNYTISYVSYEKNICNSAMYFKSKQNCYNDMLKIYMRPKENIDDFITIEIFNPKLNVNLNNNIDDKSVKRFWYAREFNPKTDSYDSSESKIFTAVRNSCNEECYYYEYDHFGLTVVQLLKIQRYIGVEDFSSRGKFDTVLRVLETKSRCYEAPALNSESTYYKITKPEIKVALDANNYLNNMIVDGHYFKETGGISINLKWNNSINIGKIGSISVNYKHIETQHDLNEYKKTFTGNFVKEAAADISISNLALISDDDYFAVDWYIDNFENKVQTNQLFNVTFNYKITNLMDYGDPNHREYSENFHEYYDNKN